jgi:hypothetical protein
MGALEGDMAAGWLIGVLVETPEEPAPLRRYYAVAKPDRAQAEWAAVDQAMSVGRIANSPLGGVEPVQAEGELPARLLAAQGVKPGMVRDLGFRTPRRWLSGMTPPPAAD